MSTRFVLALCTLLLFGLPVQANDEAANLVEQGKRLSRTRPDVALELYRTATLLDPDAPEPHLLSARILIAQGNCPAAIPELRAWLSLIERPPKDQDTYSNALDDLSRCLKESGGELVLRANEPRTCSIDGGPLQNVAPGAPLKEPLLAGRHTVVCGAFATSFEIEAGKNKSISIDGETSDGFLQPPEDLPPPPLPDEPLPDERLPDEEPLPAAPLPDAPPSTESKRNAHDQEAPDTSSKKSEEKTTSPSQTLAAPSLKPVEKEEAPPPDPTQSELEIVFKDRTWACRIGDYVCEPDAGGTLLLTDLEPGLYILDCEHPTQRAVTRELRLEIGKRVVVTMGAGGPVASPSKSPPTVESASLGHKIRLVEPLIAAGYGEAYGRAGIAGGVRIDSWSFLVGTGLDPLSLTLGWHAAPGRTGFYAAAGWALLGNGLLYTRPGVVGHALFVVAGIDVRFVSAFGMRAGVGAVGDTIGRYPVPLTLDLSLYWAP